jgi:hypothetical protein
MDKQCNDRELGFRESMEGFRERFRAEMLRGCVANTRSNVRREGSDEKFRQREVDFHKGLSLREKAVFEESEMKRRE